MAKPSLLRIVKRCQLFRPRSDCDSIPHITRGLYVLYSGTQKGRKKRFDVVYIGVAGVRKDPKRGIGGRLREHQEKGGWTHYSFFEVHDNISNDEIRELEGLLLHVLRHDSRIKLQNRQRGLNKLKRVGGKAAWGA